MPIEGFSVTTIHDEVVTKNVIFPESSSSTLKKKHYAIAYHRMREALTVGTIRVTEQTF